ncbi:MAG: response regulator [Synechococcales cyanobacterium M58_A2018_015]|nr:response regulator [Synechococcales cyanobacterium M58_A2018_015]
MLSEQQQRIMGYFIEEAKDHLNTIEQGLLNLQATIEDPEMVHEVFRAAHSVKGGAAMLGLTSIQLTAHRLEDYFKVLKECPLRIDQTLETLLLRVFDTLQDLLEQLQGPFGLTDDKSDAAMAAVEPVFTELNQHLNRLVSQAGVAPPADVNLTAAAPPAAVVQPSVAAKPASISASSEVSALRLLFQNDVPAQLREMLQLFKQADTPETRQQLQDLCRVLAQPGEQLDLPNWCDLLALTQLAITHPENSYRMLAPVVIKDLKRAQEQVLAGQEDAIAASEQLLALLPADALTPASTDLTDSELAALFADNELTGESASELTFELDSKPEESHREEMLAVEPMAADLDDLDTVSHESEASSDQSDQADLLLDLPDLDDAEELEASLFGNVGGPEMGIAELNSLADLFEGEEPSLELDWQEELLIGLPEPLSPEQTESSSLDADGDSSNLLAAHSEDLTLDEELVLEEDVTLDEELVLDEEEDLSGLLSMGPPMDPLMDGEPAADEDWLGLETLTNAEEPISLPDLPGNPAATSSEFANLDQLFAEFNDEVDSTFPTSEDSTTEDSATDADLDASDAFAALFDAPLDAPQEPGTEDRIEPPDFLLEADRYSDFSLDEQALTSDTSSDAAPPETAEAAELLDFTGSQLSNEELTADLWDGVANAPIDESAAELPEVPSAPEADQETAETLTIEPDEPNPFFLESQVLAAAEEPSDPSTDPDLDLEDLFAGDGLLAFPVDDSVDFFAEPTLDLFDESFDESSAVASTTPEDVNGLLNELPAPPTHDLDWTNLSEEALPDLTDLAVTAGELDESAPDYPEPQEREPEALAAAAPETESTGWDDLNLELPEWSDAEASSLPESATGSTNELPDTFSELFETAPPLPEGEDLDLEAMLSDERTNGLTNELAAGGSSPLDRSADPSADQFSADQPDGQPETPAQVLQPDPQADAATQPSEDTFADLEALLEASPVEEVPLAAESVSALPLTSSESTEDEFDDLEALLKDADQTLGVGSSPVRNPAGTASRRSSRRGGLNEQTMRVTVKHLDNLNNLVGEMVVNRNSLEQAQERLRQFLDNLLHQVQELSEVGQRMRDLYERSLLESSLLSSRRNYQLSTQGGASGAAQSSHATGVSFDALEMDRFTGFHTLSQEMIELIVRVRESASDVDFVVEESDQVTRNFRQITTQLQEGLTRSRMVPFAQTADRLPRGVRDNSLKYGKQAELVIEGRDTLIDKMIVEQLYDPMTHLVNNAIAHGIETPEERIAAGKSPTGRITIRAFHQGNQTVISVSDDGAGINPEKVRAKALAKGLISTEAARNLSRLDTYDLLFHHGFSTVDQVDDLRGRGVGLDVVRSNLNDIRGTISIDSTVGKGTTFTIRLPLTLSISKALCCISNRARIAFPMDGVEDMLDVPKERIQTDEQGRSCIQWRDTLLPFQPLSDLLRYNRTLGRGSVYGGNQEEDVISIVVLRSAGNFLALEVDQVLGEQEIVIKQLEGPVPKPLGVAGATVLGDGRIMPIADVLELIDLWQGRIRREAGTSLWDSGEALPPDSAVKTEPTVLIVDDSITVRELLSMTFSKVGYRVEQARDGQEAWEKLRSGLPCDLVFCDIEMPRMDGLELLSRLQQDANLNHLPIAMLTSRGADRHRQMAVQLGAKGYFTKPYLEEMLLDAAQRMLKGEVLVTTDG